MLYFNLTYLVFQKSRHIKGVKVAKVEVEHFFKNMSNGLNGPFLICDLISLNSDVADGSFWLFSFLSLVKW